MAALFDKVKPLWMDLKCFVAHSGSCSALVGRLLASLTWSGQLTSCLIRAPSVRSVRRSTQMRLAQDRRNLSPICLLPEWSPGKPQGSQCCQLNFDVTVRSAKRSLFLWAQSPCYCSGGFQGQIQRRFRRYKARARNIHFTRLSSNMRCSSCRCALMAW